LKTEAAVEMEKRRQKLQEQQMKRREEQEQKRLTYEAETNRKREAQKYINTNITESFCQLSSSSSIRWRFGALHA